MKNFDAIATVIRERRNRKTASMNGRPVERQQIETLLALADWAPTHARTEPWRFVVFEGESRKKFCSDHAALYQAHTPEESFTTAKYQNLLQQADLASHVIVVYMKRQELKKIPLVEEIAATGAAIQNLLLGAEAMGLAVFWSTGGMTFHPSMKEYLGMAEEDQVMGILYLGYSDEPAPPAKRNTPLSEKISWR